MIGVYFFLLFAGYTIFLLIQGRRSWSGPLLACHGFSAIPKKNPKSGNLASLQCNYLDMGVGLDLCGIGFPRWRSSLHFSLMPDTKQLVMTIQGSSPVAATTMTTPNTPFLLRSLYFLPGFARSTTVCHLLVLAFIFALVESATTATRLMFFSLFLFHTTDFSNTLLCLFFFFMGFRFQQLPIILGRSQPSGLRFWSSLLIALALPTCMESQSSSLIQLRSGLLPLSLSLYLSTFLFVCSTHSLLYIAGSSSLHCPGAFGFSRG